MLALKHIVVGLELDPAGEALVEGSAKAALQARWVAGVTGAELCFVHSTYHDAYRDAELGDLRLVPLGISHAGRSALEAEVTAARAEGCQAKLHLTNERVWIEVIRRALRGKADLVVVGKRAEAAADGRRLGQTAAKLLRKCPCPVWVVEPGHDLAHRLILAASDLTPVGDAACRWAAFVARAHACPLHVVHAYQVPLPL